MRVTFEGRERIYLDHNATTPIDPAVRAAMAPYLDELFGNPSSVETEEGVVAGRAVERAREQVATAIGAAANEIVFTGGCTEANNMAILGAARAQPEKRHLVTTRIEHLAVLGPVRALEREGWRVTYLDVDADGLVSPDAVAAALCEETSLVSVMGANNEVGAVQALAAIGRLCAARGVLFHSDLAQLAAYGDIDVRRDNIHLASLSAHKAYGPKGVGALYVRARGPRAKLVPLTYGGGQERGLRPGTVATAQVVGMGEALAIASQQRSTEVARLRALCERFRTRLMAGVEGAVFNGPVEARLPNNMSFSIAGLEPYALIHDLNDRISISSSSACASGKVETSHVLIAMFGDVARARGAFRIAPGRFTTTEDMDDALEAILEAVVRLRAIGAAA